MPVYHFAVQGRLIGALGIFYTVANVKVTASTEAEAERKVREEPDFKALYEKYEHLSTHFYRKED